jgi:hypothetical protein
VYASQVPGANPGENRTVVSGGVPEAGYQYNGPDAWDSEPGVANPSGGGNAAGPDNTGSLHNNIARLIQSANHGRGEGGAGTGPGSGGESWLSESGWDAAEQASEKEAGEDGGLDSPADDDPYGPQYERGDE